MKGRILILDDDFVCRDMFRHDLQHNGYECFEVGTDDDALKLLRVEPVDLITQDMQRPPGNKSEGCDFVRILKSDSDLRQIPVLIITGDSESETVALFEKAGINYQEHVGGYLSKKDALFGKLAAKVGAIIGRSR